MKTRYPYIALSISLLVYAGPISAQDSAAPDVADATAFIADAESRLSRMYDAAERMEWVKANFITDDTGWLSARIQTEYTQLQVDLANDAKKYEGLELPGDLRRKMDKIKLAQSMPAPQDPALVAELAEIRSRLGSAYSTGKGRFRGEMLPLVELEDLMRTVRDPDELLEMWQSWRDVGPPMVEDYTRMFEIANAGAQELGYPSVGEMWRAKYDMEPEAFSEMVEGLWIQMKPLYDALHCFVRNKLSEVYGTEIVKPGEPIPAHLLGNMWAQSWVALFPLVAPADADPGYDLTQQLKTHGYDAIRIVQTGDAFFQSLGFEPLPDTFWKRSLFTKPADREVACHASAWDIDQKDDLRIKMCIKINDEDFRVVHHELGHNIYQRAYKHQSFLYRDGANDGFHEAIGDMIALSITPGYLKEIGLIDEIPDASKDIGLLLNTALDKVAFFPFGLLMDKWRWQIAAGELTPETYNEGWWKLREKYQGIAPPLPRSSTNFDPGAKYHIPNNVTYIRYFLAHVLQYQFHRAACEMAGWEGPLHRCSIFGNKEVGTRFNDMLEMGTSRPWPDALEAFTGSREIDATAVSDYFAPLAAWLDEQNEGAVCGW